ncbi:MAG: long-chain fatty acid--CoA ligase [Candidatus Korobacteraceae bacterium]|jgi:long-chain acyl-CoA synthetase
MTLRTLNELFYHVVERNFDRVLMIKRKNTWVSIPSRELYRDVVGVARALQSWGVREGDRVAILSENRPEWAVTDFATMLLGATTVPIYATLTTEQTLYLLRDSGARAIFVSSADQLRKVMEIKDRCSIEKIVVMDDVDASGIVPMERLMRSGPDTRDAAIDLQALDVGPNELATIIYTSGTTGTPKGAMLTHGNLASNVLHSLYLYPFECGQVSISFMPLSHVFARHVDYVMLWHGVTVAYCPFHDELLSVIGDVKPHVFVAIPRVYEKMCNRVQSKFNGGVKRRLYDGAMRIGREHKHEVMAGNKPTALPWRLADKLFFSKVRSALGGRVELFASGGAPLSREVLDWYAAIGIPIYEGYGLTETSPIISVNNPKSCRAGSVGPVVKNIEIQVAADGEILVKGPSIFKGYWNMPEETAAVFEGEWFHTGDVGYVDDAGFLYITDRKKDLCKTSGGKFISPQPIECKLRASWLVEEVAIVADRRNFPSAIIVPSFPALEDWAKLNRVPFASREELVATSQVFALYESIIAAVNKDLARFEKIKKFIVVPDEFSMASGALTPTMKLKRRFIEQRYSQELDQLYNNEAEALRAG